MMSRADRNGPACILLNTRSFRSSRDGLAERACTLAERNGAVVEVADRPDEFARALDAFRTLRPRLIGVFGGDGTVQAVVTHLARRAAGQGGCPPLLVLAGGRTNVTASDLPGSGDPLRRLERALRGSMSDLMITERATLRVVQGGALDQQGFFFAGALVDNVIRDCHRHQQSGSGLFRDGPLGSPFRLAQLALLGATGKWPFESPEARVDVPALGVLEDSLRVLIATTLHSVGGRLSPFARRGQGLLQLTATTRRAAGFWWRLPGLLRGRLPDRLGASSGYLSGRCQGIRIEGLPGFVLDGQEFDVDARQPLFLSVGQRVTFVQA